MNNCPYCQLDTAGQHQPNCPNYTSGTKSFSWDDILPVWMPANKESEILARLDKIIELLEERLDASKS